MLLKTIKTKSTTKQTVRNLKNFASLSEIRKSIQSGSINCESIVDYYLRRINEHKNLNIYIEVFTEEAQKRAKKIDEKFSFQIENTKNFSYSSYHHLAQPLKIS